MITIIFIFSLVIFVLENYEIFYNFFFLMAIGIEIFMCKFFYTEYIKNFFKKI